MSKTLCELHWNVKQHPDCFLRDFEGEDAFMKEQYMDETCFGRPMKLSMPISRYSEHKRFIVVQGSVKDVMLLIHFFYTSIPLTVWDFRNVEDLKNLNNLSSSLYMSALERFNAGESVYWADMIGDAKYLNSSVFSESKREKVQILIE
jgi:hypothetical protein